MNQITFSISRNGNRFARYGRNNYTMYPNTYADDPNAVSLKGPNGWINDLNGQPIITDIDIQEAIFQAEDVRPTGNSPQTGRTDIEEAQDELSTSPFIPFLSTTNKIFYINALRVESIVPPTGVSGNHHTTIKMASGAEYYVKTTARDCAIQLSDAMGE